MGEHDKVRRQRLVAGRPPSRRGRGSAGTGRDGSRTTSGGSSMLHFANCTACHTSTAAGPPDQGPMSIWPSSTQSHAPTISAWPSILFQTPLQEYHPCSAINEPEQRCHAVGRKEPATARKPSSAKKLKILTSAKVLFESIVITCEGVGKTCGRWAISDRDMRSERPEFERCAPLCGHMCLVRKKRVQ